MTLAGSSGTVSFKYDPFGRRIYKSSSTGTSIYAYDTDNLIEETNAAGAVVARYSQGLNIDEPLAMLRSSATSLVWVEDSRPTRLNSETRGHSTGFKCHADPFVAARFISEPRVV